MKRARPVLLRQCKSARRRVESNDVAIEDYLYDDLFGLLIKDYLPYAHAIVFSMVSKRMKRLYEAFLIVERPPLFISTR